MIVLWLPNDYVCWGCVRRQVNFCNGLGLVCYTATEGTLLSCSEVWLSNDTDLTWIKLVTIALFAIQVFPFSSEVLLLFVSVISLIQCPVKCVQVVQVNTSPPNWTIWFSTLVLFSLFRWAYVGSISLFLKSWHRLNDFLLFVTELWYFYHLADMAVLSVKSKCVFMWTLSIMSVYFWVLQRQLLCNEMQVHRFFSSYILRNR